ncbi:hypothetical protein ACWCV5_31705 [Streptomyces tubercidicus]
MAIPVPTGPHARVIFVGVGQGDCTPIVFPGPPHGTGEVVLIDCGSTKGAKCLIPGPPQQIVGALENVQHILRTFVWEEYLAPSTDPDRKTVLWNLIRRHDPNPDSLVLALVYKQRVMVFMGDATKETEDFILGTWGAPGFPAADLTLKMGHQSSDTSSTERWIKLLKPKRLTISSGTKSFNGSG